MNTLYLLDVLNLNQINSILGDLILNLDEPDDYIENFQDIEMAFDYIWTNLKSRFPAELLDNSLRIDFYKKLKDVLTIIPK